MGWLHYPFAFGHWKMVGISQPVTGEQWVSPFKQSTMSNDKSFNQFVTLDGDDYVNPFEIIEEYCTLASLFDVRKDVFELFSIAMGSIDWRDHSPLDKSNRMFRFKTMIQIIETVYLLDHLRESSRLSYNIRHGE